MNASINSTNLLGIWDVVIFQHNECQDPDEALDQECSTATSARGCFEYHFLADGIFKYEYAPGSDQFGTYALDGNRIRITTDFGYIDLFVRFERELLILNRKTFNGFGCKEYMELEKIGEI